MLGIILYACFITAGIMYSFLLFKGSDKFIVLWLGGIYGNLLMMSGMALFASVFGFTQTAHFALLLTVILPPVILYRIKGWPDNCENTVPEVSSSGIGIYSFIFCILPLSLLIAVIMTNHILTPSEGGGYTSGQSTFGDLQMHLGFITSIAEQKVFPPSYPFLSGTSLNYPFFINMLSSSLYLFNTPLRLAILIPGYVFSLFIVSGFYIVAYKITQKKSSAVLSCILFFLGGGFGFAYFLNGAGKDSKIFTRIFTEYYTTPTNMPDYNLRWVNPICDMIIPQRTTMAGWCVFLPQLFLLLEAVNTNRRKYFVILGTIAGCMPMLHTHSFLALGIISLCLLILHFPDTNRKEYMLNVAIYGGITLILALPQLFFWTFKQTAGNESFLRFGFNRINLTDTYFWFYVKNWGIIALFLVPAFINASRDGKKLMLSAGVIMFLAEFIIFQPNEYDNNKLIFIAYIIFVIMCSDFFVKAYNGIKELKCRNYIAFVVIMAGIFSGTLSIIREYKSGEEYMTYSPDDIKMAEYIKENTPADAVFLTSTAHLNPVVTLAGRNIYCGSSLYVYFHGFGDEYYKRSNEIKNAYTGSYEELIAFSEKNEIDFVYFGENELNEYKAVPSFLSRLEKVYESGSETLYKITY